MIMYRNTTATIFLSLILLFTACEEDTFLNEPAIDLSKPVSYATQIQPIWTEDCATSGCHVTGKQTPDLSPGSSYDQLTQLGYVVTDTTTTKAEESLLYKRIIATSKPMPPDGKLSDTEISLILAWIKQGAQNN